MKPNKYNYNNQSGMYRHKISIMKRIIVKDELFQEIVGHEHFGNFWAMVKTIKGSEIVSAAQEQMNKTVRFVIKYSKSLESIVEVDGSSFEVEYKGVKYDVKSAFNDDELNETITIIADGRV